VDAIPDFLGPVNIIPSDSTALTHNHAFVEAVTKASNLDAEHLSSWINPSTGLKLIPDAWEHHGECVAGAIGMVQWQWSANEPLAYELPNHKSALICKHQLGAQLDAAELIGMVEFADRLGIPDREFANNILPLAAVVKPNGKVRMLLDPSLSPSAGVLSVNDHMQQLPCSLPSAENIFMHVTSTSILGKRDLDNGFFHVVLHPDARKYMAFRHPVSGRLGRWVVLPQGTKQSPSLFCSVTEAAARIFNKVCAEQGVKCNIFVYVDDFIFIAESHTDLRAAFEITDLVGAQLGLSWNKNKDVGRDAPTSQLEVLGLLVSAPDLTMSLPANKQASYLQELRNFMQAHTATCPRKALEQLVGKLVFASRVCRWGFLFVQTLLDALYPPFETRPKEIPITEPMLQDLSFWLEALSSDNNLWMGLQQDLIHTRDISIKQDNYQLHVYSDASKTFGVGGVLGPDDSFSARWDRDVTEEHIGALELEALLWNLSHWGRELQGSKVLAHMDNIQAVAAINKGASRIPSLRTTLHNIALLGVRHSFSVRAMYIKGETNPADAPSRGSSPAHEFVFTQAARFNQPPAEIDCWAPPSGSTLSSCSITFGTHNSMYNNLSTLRGKVIWAAPPFSEVGRLMAALVDTWVATPSTVATIVVPEWPTATWYMQYLRRKQPYFRLLHKFPAGSSLFSFRDTGRPAPPTKFPILVLRIGGANP
jgi:hypothetical protein